MTILELLNSDEIHARVTCGNRWLIMYNFDFIVYERLPYSKNSTIIINTTNEELAVNELRNDNNEKV